MTNGAYGTRLGEYVGMDTPPTIRSGFLRTSEFATTRLRWQRREEPGVTHIEAEDAFLLFLQRRDIPANPYWVAGRPVAMDPLKRGQFLLLDLHEDHASIVQAAVDCIALYFPKAAFNAQADEFGGNPVRRLRANPGGAISDPTVWHLSEAILPAVEHPEKANPLMIDHIGIALVQHLANTYGDGNATAASARGGLSPRQLRRVTDRMKDHLSERVSLIELAEDCGLSRSYFAHAFKATTGVAPLQWQMRKRIEYARELLLKTSSSIAEISEQCGFADQSHFTRTFVRIVGTTPGRWRRTTRF
jgi:AraC family transcriptional regulator